MPSRYAIMRDGEREQAAAQGFGDFFKGVRGSRRKKNLFAAVDEGRRGLAKLKVDTADGEAVAALAAGYARSIGVVRFFREKKMEDLDSPSAVRQFIEVFGRYAAEAYFKNRKEAVSHEPSLLAIAVSRDDIATVLTDMTAAGKAASDDVEVDEAPSELSLEEAVDLLADVLSMYESAIPPVDEDGSIPASIQDRGIARAAFMGLRAADLRATASRTMDVEEGATRIMLADKLADEYAGREEEIAEIVLGIAPGDSSAMIITRLVPLAEPPQDLEEVSERLALLRGRYYETGPAQWFCFGETTYSRRTLTLNGEILGYQVGATLVKDQARLQPTRQRESVSIRLRDGIAWAETNARRAGNLTAVRRVLRRTEVANPQGAMTAPAPVAGDPFSKCDSRTLWMLELLYRDLSRDPFIVDDHVMVNFERPRAGTREPASLASTPRGRRATVDAVRLKGMLLIDHPEVCDLILGNRRLVDIDLILRLRAVGVDPRFYPEMRIRLSWANDHLAVVTYPGDDRYDARMHLRLVDDVRAAATREIDPTHIQMPMQRVVTNAGRTEADDLGSVLGQPRTDVDAESA